MTRDTAAELRTRLNAETGRISFAELAPHFARGVVVRVAVELDLVEVAASVVEDRRDRVEAWMKAGDVAVATDDDARRWTVANPEFWAVVAAPWVLVQEI